jgi:hypothetical protein
MRASRASELQINEHLERSEQSLKKLNDTLPTIDSQVDEIRAMYDSGRKEANRYFTLRFFVV